jgi:fermentation-respiration switch protein FrsA (DUF1100 family)
LLRFTLVALVSASLLVVGARSASRRFLFPVHDVRLGRVPDDVTLHTLVARDGVSVRALELPAPPGARTVVHFHNNRETAESAVDVARALRAHGLGVVLVEYRGYGASRGEPTEEGLYLDAEAALDMLADRGIGPERVVLWGTSLGTGVAAEMARRGRGARLVLVSPYTSIPDLVTGAVPFVPASVLVPDHFDTFGKSAGIAIPTLVIHGDADEIVPYSMGERLARAIAGARLVRVSGGHHGDLFARERERLLAEIVRIAG